VTFAAAGARAPYPGLRSFRREESDLFFGREDFVNTMVDRLAEPAHFLAVLGSSGTGKSSVVKTGLLDALELGLMGKAGSAWRIAEFRPGSAPLHNLAAALLAPDAHATASDVGLLRGFLARGPRSVIEWCRDGNLPEGTNLLLLADQFEELFRFQDYAKREETQALVELLLESAHSTEFPIYVTLTMRSEYLGACALVEGLAEAISRGMVLIPRMTRAQCRDAIVGPAEVCGIKTDQPLVNQLLNDLASFASWDDSTGGDELDRQARRADQLPLLQYTLNRMWLKAREQRSDGKSAGAPLVLRLSDYEAIGGLRGALNAHADQLLKDLSAKGLEGVVATVFRALVSGTTVAEAVRRPRRFRDLVTLAGGNEPAVREVLDTFRAAGCNFLAPELDPNDPRPLEPDTVLDISHESLIRQWGKLSDWLVQEARGAQNWRRLQDLMADGEPLRGRQLAALASWKEEMKPNAEWAKRYGGDFPSAMAFLETSQRAEQGRRRRAVGIRAGLVVIALASTAAFAFVQTRNAEQLRQALEQARMSEAHAKEAEALAKKSEEEARKAQAEAEQARADLAKKIEELRATVAELRSMKEAASKKGQTRAPVMALGPPPVSSINYGDETTSFNVEPPETTASVTVSSPTPIRIPGGRVLKTVQLYDALQRGNLDGAETFFMVDASSNAEHATIPTADKIPHAGQPTLDEKGVKDVWNALVKLTDGKFDAPLVFFSSDVKNWEGYIAAARAIDMGYTKVYWYRGGLKAWKEANQPVK
jgi:hypothetical protein